MAAVLPDHHRWPWPPSRSPAGSVHMQVLSTAAATIATPHPIAGSGFGTIRSCLASGGASPPAKGPLLPPLGSLARIGGTVRSQGRLISARTRRRTPRRSRSSIGRHDRPPSRSSPRQRRWPPPVRRSRLPRRTGSRIPGRGWPTGADLLRCRLRGEPRSGLPGRPFRSGSAFHRRR